MNSILSKPRSGTFRRTFVLIVLFSTLVCTFRLSVSRLKALQAVTDSERAQTIRPEYFNAATGVKYVGSQACRSCHQRIFDEYNQTPMGRSMADAIDTVLPPRPDAGVKVFDPETNLYFCVFQRGKELYQSIEGSDANDQGSFAHTERIQYSIGSGMNGICYIIRKGNFLFEAPLAFYTKTRMWDLAPGFRGHDVGFSRTISPRCIGCHCGLAQPVVNRNGLYKDPPFEELSIGCENCHGPGQLHVEARKKGDPLSGGLDLTIVNPAKLPIWLATNICMYCHDDGDAQVLKPGKDFSDVRPGVPLDNVVAIFRIQPTKDSPVNSALLDRYGEMISSKCYNASGGRLGCLTCHEPHSKVPPEEAVEFYRSKCLLCHTDKSCKLPLPTRRNGNAMNDCAGCHMLKQYVEIPHSSVTNHRIVTKRHEPYPEFVFPRATPNVRDLVHLDAIPGTESGASTSLILLQAYRQVLLSTRDPKFMNNYLLLLERLGNTLSGNSAVLSALAVQATLGRKPAGVDKAIEYLRQAIAAGSTDPVDYSLLGELLLSRHRSSETIGVIRAGLLSDPWYIPYYQLLANCYISLGRQEDANEVIRKGLQQFPENRALRGCGKNYEPAAKLEAHFSMVRSFAIDGLNSGRSLRQKRITSNEVRLLWKPGKLLRSYTASPLAS